MLLIIYIYIKNIFFNYRLHKHIYIYIYIISLNIIVPILKMIFYIIKLISFSTILGTLILNYNVRNKKEEKNYIYICL